MQYLWGSQEIAVVLSWDGMTHVSASLLMHCQAMSVYTCCIQKRFSVKRHLPRGRPPHYHCLQHTPLPCEIIQGCEVVSLL